jgi:heat shock protein HslJ
LKSAFGAAALLLLAACAVPMGPETEVPEGNWLLPGTTWRLVELNGAPAAAPTTVTLTEDGRIEGQGPCNRFTAEYSGRWPDLRFQPAAATRMACPDLAAEAAFFDAIGAVDAAALGADGLTLTGPGAVRLRFVRV